MFFFLVFFSVFRRLVHFHLDIVNTIAKFASVGTWCPLEVLTQLIKTSGHKGQ